MTKPDNKELNELLRKAAGRKMTPEEVAEQRASWVRGMTQGCEHGVLNFETCPECRAKPPIPWTQDQFTSA